MPIMICKRIFKKSCKKKKKPQ